jgi:hypothetical protein
LTATTPRTAELRPKIANAWHLRHRDPMQTCKILYALSLRVVSCRNPNCHRGVLQLALLILILRGNPTRDEPYKPMTPEEPPPPTPPVAYPPRPPFHHAPLVKSDDQPAQEIPPFLLARPAAVTGRTEPDPYSDTGGPGKTHHGSARRSYSALCRKLRPLA